MNFNFIKQYMKLSTQIPLNIRLFMSGLLPILALFYFFYLIYEQKRLQIADTRNFTVQLQFSSKVNNLLEDLRQERRISLNNTLGENLRNERDEVDSTIEEIESMSGKEMFDNYKNFTFLTRLPEWREQINNRELSAVEIVSNYQMMLDRLQSYSYARANNLSISHDIGNSLQVNSILTNLVNYISLLRLQVYFRAIDDAAFKREFALSFPINYKLYKSYEQELLNSNNDSLINRYQKISQEGPLKTTLSYLDEIYLSDETENSYPAEDWWDISASGMDELLHLNQDLLQDIQKQVDLIYSQEIRERNFLTLLLIVISLLIIFFKYRLLKNIGNQLSVLKTAAQKMAQGMTDIHLPMFPRDAMGSLARSFIQIDRNNKKIAFAASQIGKNIFDTPFQLRGDKDELGTAILEMRNSLEKLSTSNENEIWIQTGLSTINNVLISDKSLDKVCKSALSKMVHYLNADIGTLYLMNRSQRLELQCTHATVSKDRIPKVIALGETRLGEAAENRKPVYLNHVPENYLSISSSTGKAQPAHLLLLPLVQNNELEGAIEIASFSPFHAISERFVSQVSTNIATTIHSIQSRLRLQELFEEVEAQSEELQLKHTELENLNTELEAQTQKLQASEEELKVQQEELIQSNQELEERSHLLEERNQIIIERNLDIQKKAEELEASTRYKSEFLANMSHELRTPLNSILLLSRLLSENSENRLSSEQVEFAEVIQTSGNNLLTLIDEILDLSKIEAGKMEMEFQSESVANIITTMRSIFAPMAKERMLDLSFDIDNLAPTNIITDRLRLEQVLKNLLSNALKFTKKGFISVRVASDLNRDWLLFKVRDSGIGIPKEKREHVFGAFQQADGSTRRKFGGTGLGLSISRELAKLLGGTLTINDQVTQGSEFILKIPIEGSKPIVEEPVVEEKEVVVIAPKPVTIAKQEERFLSDRIPEEIPDDRNTIVPGDKVILIIEDDTLFAKALMKFSRKEGYKCIVAVRGDKGIDLANQFQPQGILLDLQLPIKDGWQVMAELKGNPNTKHIPVHMMSSYEIKHESLLKGAVDFISKPVAFEQMSEIFNKLEAAFHKDTRKVLIVEENIKHAKALAYYLESFDIKVEIKKSIGDSIEALSNNKIDCVILDMGIPDAIAYKTLEIVKEKPGLEGLPIIVFTGKNLSKIEEQKIKQYADTIVVKTAHSYERIIDEVALFLHLVEQNKAVEEQPKRNRFPKFNETLTGKTVVIADDDIRNIFSLTKVLESHGMNVLTASDGKEALKVLKENSKKVDIVLMDMMMPEMDGYETIALIRKDSKLSHLPVLAVTSKAMVGDREKCIQAGASDYISKPVDPDQLISLLRVWLYH
jgi:signal transduction histidine kinase/CheY-like chemotaxis protein/HAMP domain-containing protein